MEAVVACCDYSNKENLPPLFQFSATATNPVISSKKYKKLRSRRKPLADITNLYRFTANSSLVISIQSVTPPTPTTAATTATPPSAASNPQKRKAIPEVNAASTIQQSTTNSKSKSLRMGFG